jgi:23S rRNA pseudouridine1911/1915/1917 synthase
VSRTFHATDQARGLRLDQFLVAQLGDVSRARVQELIAQGAVTANGKPAKASRKLRGGETIALAAAAERPPLKAVAENIPLEVLYEDKHLAVINKPSGMMVHAGAAKAGVTDSEVTDNDPRNRGTLVNALLHRFKKLAVRGHALRPGIVHRLDKQTSGLLVVAKDDLTHRKLQEQFAGRSIIKKYVALVHGWPKRDAGSIDLAIARDPRRRIRMTTHARGGRAALSHYRVLRRVTSPFGKFALLEVRIATGRTHQIRVHLAALRHPVVGDALYGAPAQLKRGKQTLAPGRNFLHSAELGFTHPATGKAMHFRAPLPAGLRDLMKKLGETELPDGI